VLLARTFSSRARCTGQNRSGSVRCMSAATEEHVARGQDGVDPAVKMHPELTIPHLRNAIDWVEEQAGDLVDVYQELRNVFITLVGIFGVKPLDSFSPYKKHKRHDVAKHRLTSLRGRLTPRVIQAVEPKGSMRPSAIRPTTITRANLPASTAGPGWAPTSRESPATI
jgi:hypothetical protein